MDLDDDFFVRRDVPVQKSFSSLEKRKPDFANLRYTMILDSL
jgi:hypothetical protein